jgi:transcription elongation GreA/GreB family factor
LINKAIIYQACLNFIEQRLENIKEAITQAQAASVDDTKSSAGDKYETTREMMQQEIDRNKKQLFEADQQKIALKAVENVSVSEIVKNGSLVLTSNGNFYISISAGEIKTKELNAFAISQASPIGKLLIGKRLNDQFTFNGKEFIIKDIL